MRTSFVMTYGKFNGSLVKERDAHCPAQFLSRLICGIVVIDAPLSRNGVLLAYCWAILWGYTRIVFATHRMPFPSTIIVS